MIETTLMLLEGAPDLPPPAEPLSGWAYVALVAILLAFAALTLWLKGRNGGKGVGAVVLIAGLSLLVGCSQLFNSTKLDAATTAENAAAWRQFEADAEKWWADANYPESLREAYRIRFRGAISAADAMAGRAREGGGS